MVSFQNDYPFNFFSSSFSPSLCFQILRSDSLKAKERDLFAFFFNDPPRLKRVIAELKARVDAHIVAIK